MLQDDVPPAVMLQHVTEVLMDQELWHRRMVEKVSEQAQQIHALQSELQLSLTHRQLLRDTQLKYEDLLQKYSSLQSKNEHIAQTLDTKQLVVDHLQIEQEQLTRTLKGKDIRVQELEKRLSGVLRVLQLTNVFPEPPKFTLPADGSSYTNVSDASSGEVSFDSWMKACIGTARNLRQVCQHNLSAPALLQPDTLNTLVTRLEQISLSNLFRGVGDVLQAFFDSVNEYYLQHHPRATNVSSRGGALLDMIPDSEVLGSGENTAGPFHDDSRGGAVAIRREEDTTNEEELYQRLQEVQNRLFDELSEKRIAHKALKRILREKEEELLSQVHQIEQLQQQLQLQLQVQHQHSRSATPPPLPSGRTRAGATSTSTSTLTSTSKSTREIPQIIPSRSTGGSLSSSSSSRLRRAARTRRGSSSAGGAVVDSFLGEDSPNDDGNDHGNNGEEEEQEEEGMGDDSALLFQPGTNSILLEATPDPEGIPALRRSSGRGFGVTTPSANTSVVVVSSSTTTTTTTTTTTMSNNDSPFVYPMSGGNPSATTTAPPLAPFPLPYDGSVALAPPYFVVESWRSQLQRLQFENDSLRGASAQLQEQLSGLQRELQHKEEELRQVQLKELVQDQLQTFRQERVQTQQTQQQRQDSKELQAVQQQLEQLKRDSILKTEHFAITRDLEMNFVAETKQILGSADQHLSGTLKQLNEQHQQELTLLRDALSHRTNSEESAASTAQMMIQAQQQSVDTFREQLLTATANASEAITRARGLELDRRCLLHSHQSLTKMASEIQAMARSGFQRLQQEGEIGEGKEGSLLQLVTTTSPLPEGKSDGVEIGNIGNGDDISQVVASAEAIAFTTRAIVAEYTSVALAKLRGALRSVASASAKATAATTVVANAVCAVRSVHTTLRQQTLSQLTQLQANLTQTFSTTLQTLQDQRALDKSLLHAEFAGVLRELQRVLSGPVPHALSTAVDTTFTPLLHLLTTTTTDTTGSISVNPTIFKPLQEGFAEHFARVEAEAQAQRQLRQMLEREVSSKDRELTAQSALRERSEASVAELKASLETSLQREQALREKVEEWQRTVESLFSKAKEDATKYAFVESDCTNLHDYVQLLSLESDRVKKDNARINAEMRDLQRSFDEQLAQAHRQLAGLRGELEQVIQKLHDSEARVTQLHLQQTTPQVTVYPPATAVEATNLEEGPTFTTSAFKRPTQLSGASTGSSLNQAQAGNPKETARSSGSGRDAGKPTRVANTG